jgi:hypothetical protein
MSFEPKYPLTITAVGGDGKQSGFTKILNEFSWLYGTILSGLFSPSTGHGHTGATNDGKLISTAGIADEAITTAKFATDAVCPGTANHIVDTSAAHAASAISNTPAGNIAATTVQAALAELDGGKAKLAGLSTQVFALAAATAATHGVQLGQFTFAGTEAAWSAVFPVWNGSAKLNFRINGGYSANVTSGGIALTFYTPFNTACWGVLLTPRSGSATIMAAAVSKTVSGFTINNTGATENRDWQYVAFGY